MHSTFFKKELIAFSLVLKEALENSFHIVKKNWFRLLNHSKISHFMYIRSKDEVLTIIHIFIVYGK